MAENEHSLEYEESKSTAKEILRKAIYEEPQRSPIDILDEISSEFDGDVQELIDSLI